MRSLIAFLRSEYPRASLSRLDSLGKDESLNRSVDAILKYLNNGEDLARANLPLDPEDHGLSVEGSQGIEKDTVWRNEVCTWILRSR